VLTQPIASLASHLQSVCHFDFDHLKETLRLIESYTLLGAQEFLSTFGASISSLLDDALGNVRDRGLLAVADTMDLLLTVLPDTSANVLVSPLRKAYRLVTKNTENDFVVAALAGTLCRLAFQDFPTLEKFQRETGTGLEVFAESILERVDLMYLTIRKKVALFGLCSVLSHSRATWPALPLVLSLGAQIAAEGAFDGDSPNRDSPTAGEVYENDGNHGEADRARRAALREADPVLGISVQSAIHRTLQTMQQVDAASVNSLIAGMDSAQTEQLRRTGLV